jgi:dual specificity tyrosine-phosphorylation-regulated kinase 2/3/4
MYRIHYRDFYTRLKNNQNEIRKIILDVARALELLSENNIVHSDLKTENILVRLKTEEEQRESKEDSHILETKLIDYGSSFVFSNLRQFSMATPEYMAP